MLPFETHPTHALLFLRISRNSGNFAVDFLFIPGVLGDDSPQEPARTSVRRHQHVRGYSRGTEAEIAQLRWR